jgi:transcriptional regulator with XRE-family HTH domain
MNKRRLHLRLKWKTVAELAGLSVGHLSRIRNDTSPPSELAASGIETALQWPPGTVRQIAGEIEAGPATPQPQPESHKVEDRTPSLQTVEPHSHYETAVLDVLAAMREEIRMLNEKVDALTEREPDRNDLYRDVRDQKGA